MTETAPGTTGLDERLAGVLCYSMGWLTGGLFLILERRNATVRFHAAQSVVLFGTMTVVLVACGAATALSLMWSSRAFQLIRMSGDLLWAFAAVLWLVLLLRAWRGEVWRVPLAAALADRVVGKA